MQLLSHRKPASAGASRDSRRALSKVTTVKLSLSTPRRHTGGDDNLGTRERSQLHSQAALTPRERAPRYWFNKRLAGLQIAFGRFRDEKNLLLVTGIERRIVQHVAW